jgi:lysine-N-methylase
MKLRAPKYYLDFACIADRCKHSCCIGWEIDVDADTMA